MPWIKVCAIGGEKHMGPESVSAVASCIAAGIAAWSAYLSYRSVVSASKASSDNIKSFEEAQSKSRQSANLNRLIQTVIHCNHRYSELEAERAELDVKSTIDVKLFRKFSVRYWALKSDQFDYWLAGFVDPDAFTTWFSSVAKHFASPDNFIGHFNYKDSWIVFGREYHREINPWFVTFVDSIGHMYQKPSDVDQQFEKLKEILSTLEGTSEKIGITGDFRTKFQAGLTYEQYQKMNNDNIVTELLKNRLPSRYSTLSPHEDFVDANQRVFRD